MNRSNWIRCGATAVLLASLSGARAQEQALVVSLLWAVAVGYLLWVVVVGLAVSKASWRPGVKWAAALLLVAAPWLLVARMFWSGHVHDESRRAELAESAKTLARVTPYFEQMCATQRQVPAVVSVVGRDGLYLPRPTSAPLVLEGASSEQYRAPVDWAQQPRGVNSQPDHEFEFIEMAPYAAGGELRVDALPSWWRSQGLSRVDAAQQPENLIKILGLARRTSWDISDAAGHARYMLELADISSQEDRDHWVARGRIRLTDRLEGRVIAEYVGFSLHPGPGLHDNFGGPWEHARQCPGPEQNYDSATGTWRPIDFFLQEFVRIE